MIDQRIGQPDRSEQIGRHRRLGDAQVAGGAQILAGHDPGVVDQDIEVGMIGDQRPRGRLDRCGVGDVEPNGEHPLAPANRLLKRLPPPPGDDHLIAQRVEAQRQLPPDAGPTAGDEDRISRKLHGLLLWEPM
jgi:hypothetical protein